MEIRIPAPAEEITNKLNEHGYEAYMVDGCVRGMLLGRESGDWNIITSTLPGQVKEMFRRTVNTGIQHGTVTVMTGKGGYEVTIHRIDGEYSDGRHPNGVGFTPGLVEGLRRRDFTISAMACNSHTGSIDKFEDVEDLEKGIIWHVGEPMDRFTEDTFRILRAIRFPAQLGFSIGERIYEAIRTVASNMVHVSKERIQVELTKFLLSSHPDYILQVYETGISSYVSEKFHGAYARESGNWAVPSIPAGILAVKHMRWAIFLRDCSASRTTDILRDLELDNDIIYRVRILVERQGRKVGFQDSMEDGMRDVIKDSRKSSRASTRRVMSQMEPGLFDDLFTLKMCLSEAASNDGELRWPRQVRDLTEGIRRNRDCISLRTLAASGHDIIGAGMKPGREVGNTLARLLNVVLEEPQRNTKKYLLAHLEQKKGQAGI